MATYAPLTTELSAYLLMLKRDILLVPGIVFSVRDIDNVMYCVIITCVMIGVSTIVLFSFFMCTSCTILIII